MAIHIRPKITLNCIRRLVLISLGQKLPVLMQIYTRNAILFEGKIGLLFLITFFVSQNETEQKASNVQFPNWVAE